MDGGKRKKGWKWKENKGKIIKGDKEKRLKDRMIVIKRVE